MNVLTNDSRRTFDEIKNTVSNRILTDNVLNYNKEEYILDIYNKYMIDFEFTLKLDEVTRGELTEFSEKSTNDFGGYYNRKKVKCIFYVPIEGRGLAFVQLEGWSQSTTNELKGIDYDEKKQVLNVEVSGELVENIDLKGKFDLKISDFKRRLPWLITDINRFNGELNDLIRAKTDQREIELKLLNKLDSEMGIPFLIPTEKKTIEIKSTYIQPSGNKSKNEEGIEKYYLSDKSYSDLINITHRFGVLMESYPCSYSSNTEEMIRDQLIVILNSVCNVDTNVTGETFNKGGKTDILIKYKSDIVFIAECKIWSGKKALEEAITQLKGYLTWRNTRASLIIFNKENKDFKHIIENIEQEIVKIETVITEKVTFDENAVATVEIKDETQYLKLSIQIFNLYCEKQ